MNAILTRSIGLILVSSTLLLAQSGPTVDATYSLENVYNRLNAGTAGTAAVFAEPAAGPGAAVGKSLNDIMAKAPAVTASGASATEVLTGKYYWGLTASGWGLRAGTMADNAAVSIMPSASAQTIAAGYHNGSGTVAGDTDLVAGNIKAGITIFGVAGKTTVVETEGATAAAADLLTGKTAFVNGALVTGTFFPKPNGMVLIPAGGTSFSMGQEGVASPVHTVNFTSDFYMGATEVTQRDFKTVMGVNPSGFSTDGYYNPVERVTWFDAVLYCNKRSKDEERDTVYTYTSITGTPGNGCINLAGIAIDYTKKGYRLPTEAEWEYACRGGTNSTYYWGEGTDLATLGANAWFSTNSGGTTHLVGTKLPNAYGLYDMSGNVWEWCGDRYGNYGSTAATDPTGAATGRARVLRGGNWYYDASFVRSAYRDIFYDADGSSHYIGFRVVLRP